MAAQVALITAYNLKGELLLGRRRDSGAWTLAGGHLDEGEDPADAARRELLEETGLEAQSLSPLRTHTREDGLVLHCFSAYVTGEPHGKDDPDQEVSKWKFVDVSDGIPSEIANNLHGPKDADDNLVLSLFDLKKAEDLVKGVAQRLMPFNPTTALGPEKYVPIANWQHGDGPREDIPRMQDNTPVRQRALLRLSAKTAVRRGADGKREFLLHRGMGETEFWQTWNASEQTVHHRDPSSWSPNIHVAQDFGRAGHTSMAADIPMMSAWIHEDKIRNIPKQYGNVDHAEAPGAGPNAFDFEHEVIVEPHKSKHATDQEVKIAKNPDADPHMAITNKVPLMMRPHLSAKKAEVLLEKKLEDATHLGEFKRMPGHDLGAKTAEALIGKHPPAVSESAAHFEQLNTSPESHKSWAGSSKLDGAESKRVYQHDAHKYMVKSFHSEFGPLTGWSEMTSQALYHAGGIGHLHQQVHIAPITMEENSDEMVENPNPNPKWGEFGKMMPKKVPVTRHGVVIKMEPNVVTQAEAPAHRKAAVAENPAHVASMHKIAMMDFLTANSDRHHENYLLRQDGSPVAIDHGLAFLVDHRYAKGTYTQSHHQEENWWLMHDNDITNNYAKTPDDQTWQWWDHNRNAIMDKFHEHAAMIPDEGYRKRLTESFLHRAKILDQKGLTEDGVKPELLTRDK